MSNEIFQPKNNLLLTENEQIKAYVHPTRMVILEMLASEQRTISSIAKEMNVHPANITHHFKLLEKVGLISLVEKKDTGKNLEKYYRAVAYNFEVQPKDERSNKQALVLSILKNDLTIAIKTAKSTNTKILGLLGTARLNVAEVDLFIEKLKKLLAEFEDCNSQEGEVYTINLSLYPSDTNSNTNKNILIE